MILVGLVVFAVTLFVALALVRAGAEADERIARDMEEWNEFADKRRAEITKKYF